MRAVMGRPLEASTARPLDADDGRRRTGPDSATVAVRGVSGAVATDVDLDLRPGEVVGVTGLAASGHDELPYLLTGARPARAGTVRIGSTTLDLTRCDSAAAMAAGVALVPESRENEGLALDLPVAENIVPPPPPAARGGAPAGAARRGGGSSPNGCGSSTCGPPTRR